MLRDYQRRTIENLYEWFEKNQKGHPCLVLPTGAGKSWIIAELCRQAIQEWPETRILMMSHVKELIEQDAEKLRIVWPGAPLGIYSASVGRKELGEPITFAGIQSIRNKSAELGHIDIVIVDEAHLISHKDQGGYRKLIGELEAINPRLRVIGLTATPYRLGHGLITDKPAIFSDLIEPVSIEELVHKGFLAPLRSKLTKTSLSTAGVHKRGGEFIESELQAAVDTHDNNMSVVTEIFKLAEDRKHWLLFCTGVDHARHICEILNVFITAECITGETPKAERERIIADFKAGTIQALTNANVLTTGFDYPDVDLIAMLRPTMSPGLYVQMAGRGMRPKSHTDRCLVLDFAGVVRTHGPITAVKPPSKKGEGDGEAPVKVCEECDELVHISAKECPNCGAPFPVKEPKVLKLHNEDIMGLSGSEMEVTEWQWRVHTSRASGKDMLKVSYYGSLSDPKVDEYLAVTHEGYAGQKALGLLVTLKDKSGAPNNDSGTLQGICEAMNQGEPPKMIEYKKDGKFFRVIGRVW